MFIRATGYSGKGEITVEVDAFSRQENPQGVFLQINQQEDRASTSYVRLTAPEAIELINGILEAMNLAERMSSITPPQKIVGVKLG